MNQMFSILIPCLKREYLASQLYWLSQQTFKDFTVVVMDGYYKEHRGQPFMQKAYPFQLIHVPLVENKLLAKRYDFSIRNNLAMLAPTFHFVFISDTTYVPPEFAKSVFDFIMRTSSDSKIGVFEVWNLAGYNLDTHAVTLQSPPSVQPNSMHPFIFNKRDFIYILNGYDEIWSYASANDFLFAVRCTRLGVFERLKPDLAKIVHPKTNFVWYKEPCTKCSVMFEERAINCARDYESFFNNLRLDVDHDLAKQMTYFDKDLGCMMFQCGNCGFGGAVCDTDYKEFAKTSIQSPVSALDGRAGRDLAKVYDLMTAKCANDVDTKLSFLRNSY